MERYKVSNIKQAYINGRAVTIFELYTLAGGAWVMQGAQQVAGHYKKATTILKHYIERGQ